MNNNEVQAMVDRIAKELQDVYDGNAINEEGEVATFYDYFNDALDIEYTIGSDKAYRGVRIMVACGGPNIYVDTRAGEVQLFWWTDHATAWVQREVCDAIDEVWEEYYNC